MGINITQAECRQSGGNVLQSLTGDRALLPCAGQRIPTKVCEDRAGTGGCGDETGK